jgi:hypothetical protein
MRAVRIIVYAFAGLGSRQVGWRDDHGWRAHRCGQGRLLSARNGALPDDDADRGVTLTYFRSEKESSMGARITQVLLLATGLATGACATSGDWAAWSQNSSHFASGQHALFSMNHQGSSSAPVTRADVDTARTQAWWGVPITVSSAQILEK